MSDTTMKRGANITFVAALLGGSALGWALSTVWSDLDTAMHKARCPPSAFAAGGLGGVVSPFAVGLFVCFLVLWVVVLTSSRYEIGRTAYATVSPPPHNPTISALAKGMAWTTGFAFVTALGFCSVEALTSFCLQPAEINIHPSVLGGEHAYMWNQVRKVKTTCWLGHKPARFVYNIDLIMDDGYKLQLPERQLSLDAPSSAVEYFQGLSTSLSGLPFTFDASSIEPSCRRLGVLAGRP